MKISFDRVAEVYDKTRGLPTQVMSQLIEKLIYELSDSKTILDAGVGTGRFAKPLKDIGLNVVGIDIAKEMIKKAIKIGVDKLLFSDALFLPFRNSSFDVAISIHLLHLIREWKEALQEICRVTKEKMLSMDYRYKNPIRTAYNRLLRSYGYEPRRVGKGEWELKYLIRPSKSLLVASFDIDANETLAYLGQRVYSSQWEIPEEINDEIVKELKGRFADKLIPQELHILVWNMEDLRPFCRDSLRWARWVTRFDENRST
ncbi:MAG: class I SAM-dependent methyltransferase [Candidatus Hodarchaeota archaeon]